MFGFLINLDRSPDRLAHMRDQLGRTGFEAVRVSAIDGRYHLPDHLGPQFPPSKLTLGEVGCYASHLVVMEQVRDRGLPHAVVLEDDADLDLDFASLVDEAVAAAPAGWDIIHISTTYKSRTYPVARLRSGHEIVRFSRRPLSTTAYIVSAQGCRKFLVPRPRTRPIDQEFRQGWHIDLDIVGLKPSIAHPDKQFASTITKPPGKRRWGPRTLSEVITKLRYEWRKA